MTDLRYLAATLTAGAGLFLVTFGVCLAWLDVTA